MHVTRKTNQEMVVLDSSIWISIFLLCASLFAAYRLSIQHNTRGFLSLGFMLLFILLFWRKEVVVFDAARQQATWTRRRIFKVANGTIPFNEITGINLEATSSKNDVLVYRLAILTTQGSVPMSDSYAGNLQKYERLKQEILEFVNPKLAQAAAASNAVQTGSVDYEESIRSLLQQGRKIDAIHLLRTTQKVSLVEATDRIAEISRQMNAAK
ncbi:MAG: hypothetical protein JST28_18515 [Acidobacteria bacterium]|nr:hypothetical protein [Acidobacteriota bacterium]